MEIRECLAKENISYFHFELEKCPFVFTLFFKYLYRKQSGGGSYLYKYLKRKNGGFL
jgi:hypothetical protein